MTPRSETAVLLRRRPEGEPRPDDFEILQRSCPEPGEGEVRLQTLWL